MEQVHICLGDYPVIEYMEDATKKEFKQLIKLLGI